MLKYEKIEDIINHTDNFDFSDDVIVVYETCEPTIYRVESIELDQIMIIGEVNESRLKVESCKINIINSGETHFWVDECECSCGNEECNHIGALYIKAHEVLKLKLGDHFKPNLVLIKDKYTA